MRISGGGSVAEDRARLQRQVAVLARLTPACARLEPAALRRELPVNLELGCTAAASHSAPIHFIPDA